MEPDTPRRRRRRALEDAANEDQTKQVHVDQLELGPGTKLGEYELVEPLGRGGMGVVYAAVHETIGKHAAIKVIKKEVSDSYNVERFIDEARVVNAIRHPNIVDIFAFGEMPDGRCYYVMELLVGESLDERIDRAPLSALETCTILRPLVRALEAAHKNGVIHRDVKPDNVFLVAGEAQTVKLLDFGIAKLSNTQHRVSQTATGAIVGTPQYIAPEQAKGHGVDHRADIYSLGAVTFEMLTGRPPFEADNAAEMIAKHLMEQPVAPSTIAHIPPELDALVLAMLAKTPDQRPTLAQITLVIDRVLASTTAADERPTNLHDSVPPPRAQTAVVVSTPAPMLTERARAPSRWPFALVALGALATATIVTYLILSSFGAKEMPASPDALVAVVENVDAAVITNTTTVTPIIVGADAAPAIVDAGVTPADAARVVRAPDPPALGRLVIQVNNASRPRIRVNANVYEGPELDRKVAPGWYTVTVTAEGRKPFTMRVQVTRGGIARKTIELEPDLMPPSR